MLTAAVAFLDAAKPVELPPDKSDSLAAAVPRLDLGNIHSGSKTTHRAPPSSGIRRP